MNALIIWLILAVRHWLRCVAFAIPLSAFVLGGYYNGGGLVGLAIGTVVGFGFGLMLAFHDEIADLFEK